MSIALVILVWLGTQDFQQKVMAYYDTAAECKLQADQEVGIFNNPHVEFFCLDARYFPGPIVP